MDSLKNQVSTLSSLSAVKSRKRKAPNTNVYVSIKIPSRHRHFHGPIRRQAWSLPESMIYYITKYPSTPMLYQKLTRSCKYFFSKNPIIVCERLIFDSEKNQFQIKMELNDCSKNFGLKCNSQRFWISCSIYINQYKLSESVISSIIPNIRLSTFKRLNLRNQTITFNEYVTLASNAENIHMYNVFVKNEDGSAVALDKLVEAAAKAKEFGIDNLKESTAIHSPETIKKLIQIPHFHTLNSLFLSDIPDSFDIDTFFTYIKKNKITNIILKFSQPISNQYRNRLQAIVNEIVATENRDYKPPFISFNGGFHENWGELRSLFIRSRKGIL